MISKDIETVLDNLGNKMDIKELSTCSGVPEATIRRILNQKVETSFINLFNLSNCLFERDSKLFNWCYVLELPGNMKAAMEFMFLKKEFGQLRNFIDNRVMKSNNKSVKKWARIYLIISEYEEYSKDHFETLKRIREISYSDKESEILLKLIEANIFYRIVSDSSAYLHEMTRIVNEVQDQVQHIKDKFLQEAFLCRVNDLQGKSYLYVKSNAEKAREYAEKNLRQNICQLFKGNSLYIIGRSYNFSDYKNTREYAIQAINVYRENGYSYFADEVETYFLPFVDAHFGEKVDSSDIEGKAHYESKWGDKQKGQKYINEAIDERGECMFTLYYKGLAFDDPEILFKSFSQFLQIGDNYYAQLPLEALKKFETYSRMAEIMYKQFVN
ncbi:AimR family lysis-lysogeny pheromone receptor [Cytobacillus sp. FSL R7-0696]|uniref:AimR family lysis-lysogeny pheromone receptor n=1 Tax=Cytobacillus sp. FSL R7-0696 TaxID=2921691 RepID=UPI0030F93631